MAEKRNRIRNINRLEREISCLEEENSDFAKQRIHQKNKFLVKLRYTVLQLEEFEMKFRLLAMRSRDVFSVEQETVLLADFQLKFTAVEREMLKADVSDNFDGFELRPEPDVPTSMQILETRVQTILNEKELERV